MNTEAALTNEIGLAMLNSRDFATCHLERFSTKRTEHDQKITANA
jgi:hypothetical protein